MATIQNSIVLTDQMTSTFTSIITSVNHTISALRTLSSTGVSVDTGALDSASVSLRTAEESMNRLTASSQTLNNNISSTAGATAGLGKKLMGVAATFAAGFSIAKIIEASDKNAQITARLNLISDDPETLKKQIYAAANDAGAAYSDVANQVAKLGMLAGNAFGNTDEIVRFSNLMSKSFKLSGADIQESTAGMYQLTQAMASGKLQGDEFRSIMENAPMLAQAIAKEMNVPMGELKKLGAAGEITADVIKSALFNAGDDINSKFAQMPLTWSSIWTRMVSFATIASDGILKKINTIVNTQAFSSLMKNLQIGFNLLLIAVNATMQGIGASTNFVIKNWGLIKPVITGLASAFLWYAGVQAMAGLATISSTVASIAHNAALAWQIVTEYAAIAATEGLAAAQGTLNAAVYAFPGTWIVMLIVAVVAAVISLIIIVIKWATSSATVIGTVVGMFYWLWAAIQNVGIGIWNVFLWLVNAVLKAFYWLYNGALSVASFLVNAYNAATTALNNAFIWMVNGAIRGFNKLSDGANSIANSMQNSFFSAINAISKHVEGFVNSFLKGLNEVGKVVDSVIGTHFSNGGAFQVNLGGAQRGGSTAFHITELGYQQAKPGVQFTQQVAPQFNNYGQFKDMSDAFLRGRTVGDNWANNLGNSLNGFEKLLSNPMQQGMLAGEDPAGGGKDGPAGRKTADHTKRMADKMDNLDEDLQYLRDIAEQDYINKFTTAEIKLEIKNENSITSDVDVDNLLDKMEERIVESIYVGAEGVHE